MKTILVCLILGCFSLSFAQEALPPRPNESVNIQRLFKFSGTLTGADRATFAVGPVALRFAIYNVAEGGEASWQETQNVNLDAQGRYTVLLGEKVRGGLPSNLFGSGEMRWLGVQAPGQMEEPRIIFVESSALAPATVSPATPASEGLTPYDRRQRYLLLTLLLMFLWGIWMLCGELRKWWKVRTEQYGEPPFANPFRFLPSLDELRRGAQRLRYSLSDRPRSNRGRIEHSIQALHDSSETIDIDKEQPKAA